MSSIEIGTRVLDPAALDRALRVRDLTDPSQGEHAMQLLVRNIHDALAVRWGCRRRIHRASPLVAVGDNYDRLGYSSGAVVRDSRYTRYVTPGHLLRTQTSAMIPGLLQSMALDPPDDVLLICPGLVYRRDVVDRLHLGESHQLDLWRLTTRRRLDRMDLLEMIDAVVAAALPGRSYRTTETEHPYTSGGLQVDVEVDGDWIEIGECGLAAERVLEQAGLDIEVVSGLAMGLGLDRLLMIRKQISDIRLLRSGDPRVVAQMCDLHAYQPVSNQPAVVRDLSLAVDSAVEAEDLGDRSREVLGERADELESIEILDETSWEKLPDAARSRMGMRQGQKNVLLRLVIRHPTRTLTSGEANELRDLVYGVLHEGSRAEWTSN